ncbi:MAG: tetratricopeptide repeat protein, partial [Planctomycetota bacterium]
EWDWERAESQFKQAIKLNPNYATAHHWYSSNFLNSMGRYDEALVGQRRAQELDPGSNIINTDVGSIYYCMRQYDRAIEAYKNVLGMDEGFWKAHWDLARTYLQKEMYEEALAEIQKAEALLKDWQPWIQYLRGIVYARRGQRGEAEQVLDSLLERSKQQYVPPSTFADIYFALGENDTGFEWLEKAITKRVPYLIFLNVDPIYDPIRSDPQFTAILKEIGLDK